MNLTNATPTGLHAAFLQDAWYFLEQFELAIRAAGNPADAAQAFGQAGEALRGVRIGAEFLGLSSIAALCREGEGELLMQLPHLRPGQPTPLQGLGAIARALRAEVETGIANGKVLAYLAQHAQIHDRTYTDDRVTLRCSLPRRCLNFLSEHGVHVELTKVG